MEDAANSLIVEGFGFKVTALGTLPVTILLFLFAASLALGLVVAPEKIGRFVKRIARAIENDRE